MNLTETVFCYPARGTGHVRIRIFTPEHELPFAGHPVLGSAFVLAAPLQLPEIVLETGMGPVPVRLERDGPRIVFGRMVQPVPRVEAVPDPLRCCGRWESSARRRGGPCWPSTGSWRHAPVGARRSSRSRRPDARTAAEARAPRPWPWARLLQRVFGFEVLVCDRCAGPRRILGAVTEPPAVRRVLVALGLAAQPPPGDARPAA